METSRPIIQPPRHDPLEGVAERHAALIRDLDAEPVEGDDTPLDVDSGFRASVVPAIMEAHRAADRLSPPTGIKRAPIVLRI